MAVTATRTQTIVYSGDVVGTETLAAATNAVSPGSVEVKTLASGFNEITLPTGGATVRACTIVPPTSNTVSITLKGVTGDTGTRINDTDPTTLTFHTTGITSFGLTAAAQIVGVRLFWT